MAAKWGEDSDIYRVRVLGDFPRAQSDSFIGLDLVEAAVRRGLDGGYDDGVVEIGLDVARFGDDETVFAIRRGGRVLPIESVRGWDTMKTAGRAVQLIREYAPRRIKIDDTGVGGGVVDRLNELVAEGIIHNCDICPMNFGGTGDDDYHNAVSLWHGLLKDLLKAGECVLPDDEDLIAQLTTRKYGLNSKGRIVLEDKATMKKRGLPSPDRAEAVALAFAAPQTVEQKRIAMPLIAAVKTR